MTRAYAPASIGNFAAGFDILGAAIQAEADPFALGDIVSVQDAAVDTFATTGEYADRLPPSSADNLVVRARDAFRGATQAQGRTVGPLAMTLEKRLPLNSGLGSSAASIVAALVALNAHSGSPLSTETLYQLAGSLEGTFSGGVHHDNTGPSLLGGLLLVRESAPQRLLLSPQWRLCVVHPHLEVPTAQARAVLPTQIPRSGAIEFALNLALFVHALHMGNADLVRETLRDPLAEPHRAALVPRFYATQAKALAAGALGCSFSGSGPSLFALAETAEAPSVLSALLQGFSDVNVQADGWVCTLDPGARVIA